MMGGNGFNGIATQVTALQGDKPRDCHRVVATDFAVKRYDV
jgi:hypothetical protein